MPSRCLELCVCLCESVCMTFVTICVCVGVTVNDLVDMEVGLWVNFGIWL